MRICISMPFFFLIQQKMACASTISLFDLKGVCSLMLGLVQARENNSDLVIQF